MALHINFTAERDCRNRRSSGWGNDWKFPWEDFSSGTMRYVKYNWLKNNRKCSIQPFTCSLNTERPVNQSRVKQNNIVKWQAFDSLFRHTLCCTILTLSVARYALCCSILTLPVAQYWYCRTILTLCCTIQCLFHALCSVLRYTHCSTIHSLFHDIFNVPRQSCPWPCESPLRSHC